MEENATVSFAIIGSGIAGMSTALHLSQFGNVVIYTKSQVISGSTPLAQGGIAGVVSKDDTFESHIEDTINAGRGENKRSVVEVLVRNAPQEIQFLRDLGVPFEKEQHLEGGHSFPRISNVKDISGKVIAEVLAFNVLANKNITIQEYADVYHLDAQKKQISYRKKNKKYSVVSDFIIIATGGYSSLYRDSTSPKENMGDGISLAIEAGIKTKDLHKVQFHPTVLNKQRDNKPQLLLTEAIRGFGATIINTEGEQFIDPLLPRDVVAKAIYDEEQRQKSKNCVFLDARKVPNFADHFPFITETLQNEFFLDPQKEVLPITFGAHYCMGGIETNILGETSCTDIYAVGECANTGVHGENRLASNSLLEGVVFARQIARDIAKKIKNKNRIWHKEREERMICDEVSSDHGISDSYNTIFLQTIRNTLSQYLSIETEKEKKQKNIQIAKDVLWRIRDADTFSFLSQKNKMVFVLVQQLVQDAEDALY